MTVAIGPGVLFGGYFTLIAFDALAKQAVR